MDLKDWTTYVMPFGMLMLVLSQTTVLVSFEIVAAFFYWYMIVMGCFSVFLKPEQMVEALSEERRVKFLENRKGSFAYSVSVRIISVLLLAYFGWNNTVVWFSIASIITLTKLNQIADLIEQDDKYQHVPE